MVNAACTIGSDVFGEHRTSCSYDSSVIFKLQVLMYALYDVSGKSSWRFLLAVVILLLEGELSF
jgi:hypothetical protein